MLRGSSKAASRHFCRTGQAPADGVGPGNFAGVAFVLRKEERCLVVARCVGRPGALVPGVPKLMFAPLEASESIYRGSNERRAG